MREWFRRLRGSRSPDTGNTRRISELKDIHSGRRGFVIGTGPSLSVSDLDKLTNEITFGCNKIYLAFDDTAWRPTYYSVLDRLVAESNADTIASLQLKKIFSGGTQRYLPEMDDALWVTDLARPPAQGGKEQFKFSTDLAHGTYGGFTVIFMMLQVAFYMGIREVYLLGMDFSFDVAKNTGRKTPDNEPILENNEEVNHFHPDYRKTGEQWTMPRLDLQHAAFTVAKKAFEAAGGRIMNASRKTKLDVFPCVNLDRVISAD